MKINGEWKLSHSDLYLFYRNINDSEGKYPYGQLVLELEKGVFDGKKWQYHMSPAYNVDEKAAEEFDRQFPKKEKGYQSSQEEFSIAVRAYLS